MRPPEGRPSDFRHVLRARWTLLTMHGSSLIVVVLLLALVSAHGSAPLAASPSPSAVVGAEPSPSVSPTPSAGPNPIASPAPIVTGREQQQQFRTYVSVVTIDGSGLLAAMIQLHNCNGNRDACRRALDQVSTAVTEFEGHLDSTPAPPCLSDVDTQLRSGLGFFDRGLALVREGGNAKDQLKVVQGTILISAGTWKVGVAMRRARQSQC